MAISNGQDALKIEYLDDSKTLYWARVGEHTATLYGVDSEASWNQVYARISYQVEANSFLMRRIGVHPVQRFWTMEEAMQAALVSLVVYRLDKANN